MGSLAAYTGSGTLLALSVSSWDTDVDIRDITFSGASRGFIETTHMNTTIVTSGVGSRTFLPHRHGDAGTMTVDFLHHPDFLPPLNHIITGGLGVPEVITVSYIGADNAFPPDGAIWTVKGFVIDLDVNIPWDGPEMTGSCTWKLSGNCAIVADA